MSSPDVLDVINTDVLPPAGQSRSLSPVPSGPDVAADDDVIRNASVVNCLSPPIDRVCLERRSECSLNVSPKLDADGGAVVDRLTDFSIDALLKTNRRPYRSGLALPLSTDGSSHATTEDWSVAIRAHHNCRVHTAFDVDQLEYSSTVRGGEGGGGCLLNALCFTPGSLRSFHHHHTSQLQEHFTTRLEVEIQSEDLGKTGGYRLQLNFKVKFPFLYCDSYMTQMHDWCACVF